MGEYVCRKLNKITGSSQKAKILLKLMYKSRNKNLSTQINSRGANGVAQMVDHLPPKPEALSSNHSATKKKKIGNSLKLVVRMEPSKKQFQNCSHIATVEEIMFIKIIKVYN
jgi:hypothetical protein